MSKEYSPLAPQGVRAVSALPARDPLPTRGADESATCYAARLRTARKEREQRESTARHKLRSADRGWRSRRSQHRAGKHRTARKHAGSKRRAARQLLHWRLSIPYRARYSGINAPLFTLRSSNRVICAQVRGKLRITARIKGGQCAPGTDTDRSKERVRPVKSLSLCRNLPVFAQWCAPLYPLTIE